MSNKVKDQLDILKRGGGASSIGRSSEIEIVRVKSKVNKKAGRCNTNPYRMQPTVYDPCRRVSTGQMLLGRINEDKLFIPDHKVNLAPSLEENEYYLMVEPNDYEPPETLYGNFTNRNIKLFLGALIIGFLIYKYNKK